MDLLELDGMTDERWRELGAEEPGAWGGGPAEAFQWREKERHLGLSGDGGELMGVAEALLPEVAVGDGEPFEVVGIGGVFVRPSRRGQGLMRTLVDAILQLAAELGPERAMLFCDPPKVAVYQSFGFQEIVAPVWVQQPRGRTEMPLRAMWRALHGSPGWPAGRVEVQGLPF
jgi:GNAT superfamily N-acetyltransferase